MDEKCEHGCEGACMLCVREGEGKPVSSHDDRETMSFEDCMTESEPWPGG